jgi:hypothetical protein
LAGSKRDAKGWARGLIGHAHAGINKNEEDSAELGARMEAHAYAGVVIDLLGAEIFQAIDKEASADTHGMSGT